MKAQPVGTATFVEGTDQFYPPRTDDLGAAWAGRGDGKVSQVIVVSQLPASAPPSAEEAARITGHLNQAARISGEVGDPVPTAKITHHPPQDTAALPGCPAVTVLVTAAD